MHKYQTLRVIHPATMSGGTAYYRAIGPSGLLKSTGHHQVFISDNILSNDDLDVLNPDAIIWQSQYTNAQIEAMERYRKHKPSLYMAYELNDMLWDIPDQNIFKKDIPFDIKHRITKIFSVMDNVICSNEALAEEVKKTFKCKNVTVVENSLSFDTYRILKGSKTNVPRTKPRVGWAGGIGHLGDLAVISDLVNRTADKYQWVFFGLIPPGIDAEKIEFHPAVNFDKYLMHLRYLDLDVAVAPLEHHVFNKTKSNLRLIEYGACEYPVVASNYGPYVNHPCILVDNSTDAWEEAIDDLIADPAKSKELSRRLGAYLLEHHVSEKLVNKWHEAWGSKQHIPVDVAYSGELVAVSTSGIVMDGDTPIETFVSIEEALEKRPNASILWADKTTWISNTLVSKIKEAMEDVSNVGSITPLSNRGDFLSFPKIYEINKLNPRTAKAIVDGIVEYADNPIISIPQPSGPVVFMSNVALGKVGIPRINELPPEFAFAEWGTAIKNAGMDNVAILSEYAYTMNVSPFSNEIMQYGINRIKAYCPEKSQHYEAWNRQAGNYIKKRQSIEILMHKKMPSYPVESGDSYEDWVTWFDSPDADVLKNYMIDKDEKIKFGVVLPIYKPNFSRFKETIDSLNNQVYKNFKVAMVLDDNNADEELIQYLNEVCLDKRYVLHINDKNLGIIGASSKSLEMLKDSGIDWVFFLDNEDTIPIHCLVTLNDYIKSHPESRIFYTDSDLISKEGVRSSPFFKPGYDYTRLLCQNYFSHLTLFDYNRVMAIGGCIEGYEGSQDYDLVLRYIDNHIEDRSQVTHIDRILYHWRVTEGSVASDPYAKPYALESARKAIKDHLLRRNQLAWVGQLPAIPIWTSARPMVVDSDKNWSVSSYLSRIK